MSRNAHPAGPRHGDVLPDAPAPSRPGRHERPRPGDLAGFGRRASDGVLSLGGAAGHRPRRRARHAGAVPGRGRSARPGAGLHRRVRRRGRVLRGQGVPLHRGRALDRRGGARPGRVHRRRARRGARGRLPGRAHRACTATTSRSPSSPGRSRPRVGHIVRRLVRRDRTARRGSRQPPASGSASSSGSPSGSRRTPTSSSPPRTRTRSSASRCATAPRPVRSPPCSPRRSLQLRRAALAHRLADLRDLRLRGRRAPRGRASPRTIRDVHGVQVDEINLGGGLGIAYVPGDDPESPKQTLERLSGIVELECASVGLRSPRLSVEPGRAIVGPSGVTVYEVGTVKDVTLDGGHIRRYVSVDGGMSDNIRTALYDADYTCVLANRASDRGPGRRAGSSASTARAATSSSATPGCPATSGPATCSPSPPPAPTAAAWPATTTTCPGRPVVAVRDGQRPGDRPPRDRGRPAGARHRVVA